MADPLHDLTCLNLNYDDNHLEHLQYPFPMNSFYLIIFYCFVMSMFNKAACYFSVLRWFHDLYALDWYLSWWWSDRVQLRLEAGKRSIFLLLSTNLTAYPYDISIIGYSSPRILSYLIKIKLMNMWSQLDDQFNHRALNQQMSRFLSWVRSNKLWILRYSFEYIHPSIEIDYAPWLLVSHQAKERLVPITKRSPTFMEMEMLTR